MLFIENGQLLDPYTGKNEKTNVLIGEDGIIQAIGARLTAPEGCPKIDAAGQTISPGLVDVHVHFRDPGQTEKEDLMSGAAAAAAGGFTTVVCMANTKPTCDSVEILQDILNRAKQAPIHVLQSCAVTKGLQGQELTNFEALLEAGAAGFTDDGINLTNAGLCAQAMELAAQYHTLLSFHEEDPSLVCSPGVNFGSAAAQKFGVLGAKPEAEETMIARDIALALRTGARVLFQHVSSANSVAWIRMGKQMGAHIYAEVTPHHIALTQDAVLQHGTYARMNPPLRTEQDRQALIEGLRDGTLDAVATDHAPHTAEEKAREFAKAPSGIIGLETAFSVCNTKLVQTGILDPMTLLRRMSMTPAQMYGLQHKAVAVGNYAELVLLDWNAEVVYEKYHSKACNTPFTNMPLRGKVCGVIMGDKKL